MSIIVPLPVLKKDPKSIPSKTAVALLHVGEQADRQEILDHIKYNPAYEGLILSALYIAPTLEEARAKAISDGWS